MPPGESAVVSVTRAHNQHSTFNLTVAFLRFLPMTKSLLITVRMAFYKLFEDVKKRGKGVQTVCELLPRPRKSARIKRMHQSANVQV